MQIDMHRVDAEIARAHAPDDGVVVRAVTIEVATRAVDEIGDLLHIALEQAARVRVRHHHSRDIRPKLRFQRCDIDAPVFRARHFIDAEPARRRRRRICAVRGARHQHALAHVGLATRFKRGADRQHAAKFAVRAGLRRKRHGGHAGERHQPMRDLIHQFERALDRGGRLQRMQIRETFHARDALVQARIVLHRARAEREETKIDRVILLRQTHVMADRFGLGEPRQSQRRFPLQAAERILTAFRLRQINARRLGVTDFKDQLLGLQQAAIAGGGFGDHAQTSKFLALRSPSMGELSARSAD
ncbi:hypothetical protein U91I_03897 [alpha proteobacterium U9-1i]|nr:hypothetical protein U91I_03897 [alpha proteobacterium U9-1i]